MGFSSETTCEGIILWSPSPDGDKLWLLSSGKFLYIRTIQYKADGGIGWSHISWIGEPIESEDPSKLPQVLMSIVCDNISYKVLDMLVNLKEIDEPSFKTLLNLPQWFLLRFLTKAPCSKDVLQRYGDQYGVRDRLVEILSTTEDKQTCDDVLEILNKFTDAKTMLDLIIYYMLRKPNTLRPLFNEWRARIIESS
ncbi:MAG: hypothetical protein QW390_01845 [Candidatus Bathyarchaeia archaeon]